ncbi:MAG: pyridoxamine 5'-phosphate oxidase family protein [Kiloniellales bacterium]
MFKVTSGEGEASPFHPGEQSLQSSAGVRESMERVGRKLIRRYMPDQHRAFFRTLPFLVVGALDEAGQPWASLLTGRPGFVDSPDPRHLRISAKPLPGDPAAAGLKPGKRIGGLGIELHTRRRNRFTARLGAEGTAILAEIEHSFGNCPQYIQTRTLTPLAEPEGINAVPKRREAQGLDAAAKAIIAAADTFFVATAAEGEGRAYGVDVSHRGGKAGFVRIGADDLLTIPDFAGNLLFNTLGNLLVNPRAGLLFVDFESGDLLYLAGRGTVILDSPEIAAFRGAERLWTFKVERSIRLQAALPFRFVFAESAATSLATGSWEEAAGALEAGRLANSWRPYRVDKIVRETAAVRSFFLVPTDGKGLPSYRPGQFLPIRIAGAEPLLRSYTLTSLVGDPHLRITVKREAEGRASRKLHDSIVAGSVIEAMGPRGDFLLDLAVKRPAVFLSGGIGITPMLAMLRGLVAENARTRAARRAWFLHSARTAEERPFVGELSALANSDGAVTVLGAQTATGERLSARGLRDILPFDDYDFFICGPASMSQDLYDGLRELNVSDARIHLEAFGPASVRRRPDQGTAEPLPHVAPAEGAAKVRFAKSAVAVDWRPEKGSLLDLAEAAGLKPAYACRNGLCGTCALRVIKGAVSYPEAPSARVRPGEVLACSAVPRAGSDYLELDA